MNLKSNFNSSMPPIPIPMRSPRYFSGKQWDETQYMNSPPNSMEQHKCYSYPCHICHRNQFSPPSILLAKSYICMDKKPMLLGKNINTTIPATSSYHIKDDKENEYDDDAELEFKMDDCGYIDFIDGVKPITEANTKPPSPLVLVDDKHEEPHMEFEFDVIYESIDDLPASVFEDIALSLLEQQEEDDN